MKFDEDLVTAAELQITNVFEKELQNHYPEYLKPEQDRWIRDKFEILLPETAMRRQ